MNINVFYLKGHITKGYIVGLHHPQEKRLKFCGHRETRSLWRQYAVGWCEGIANNLNHRLGGDKEMMNKEQNTNTNREIIKFTFEHFALYLCLNILKFLSLFQSVISYVCTNSFCV